MIKGTVMTRHGFYVLIIAVLNIGLLSGCGEESSVQAPAPKQAQKVVPPPPKAAVPQPAAETVEPTPSRYVYDPIGRRDPFESPIMAKQAASVPEASLTPLEKFNIGQLRLIGVIIGKGQPRAMVVAPDGKSYVLKKGVKVGGNEGVVVGITPEAVEVEERYFDFSGEIRKSVQLIQLPKREGVE